VAISSPNRAQARRVTESEILSTSEAMRRMMDYYAHATSTSVILERLAALGHRCWRASTGARIAATALRCFANSPEESRLEVRHRVRRITIVRSRFYQVCYGPAAVARWDGRGRPFFSPEFANEKRLASEIRSSPMNSTGAGGQSSGCSQAFCSRGTSMRENRGVDICHRIHVHVAVRPASICTPRSAPACSTATRSGV
jgi:hypothetical protein